MRIAIIGGRGFIGRNLSNELMAAGHQVIIVTRAKDTKAVNSGFYVNWDGKDRKALQTILEKCDAVVNLAGENIGVKPWTKARKEMLRRSRVETTNVLVDSLNELKKLPLILIQASAIGFYGVGDQPVDENSPAGKDWLAKLCVEWEDPLTRLNEKNTRVVIIRNGVVLGKQGSVLQKLLLPIKLFIGGPLGKGNQWISWIHIEDEARAIRYLLENEKCCGIYNLTAPEAVQNAEMVRTLARITHRPFWIRTPAFLLRMALGEMSTIVLDGQRVLPSRLTSAGFIFNYNDLEKALRDLL